MTRSDAVDAYIAKAAPFAQAVLTHVRERVHAAAPDVEEAIKWGMPAYLANGRILLITAAFKAHAAVNFWRGGEVVPHGDVGAMGQFGRLTSLTGLPSDDRLDALIAEAAAIARRTAPAPRKPRRPPRPQAAVHPDFEKALAASTEARATFEGFPPSCRREYADWIAEAKREDTRARRIAQAIEMLRQGRKRNWKYER